MESNVKDKIGLGRPTLTVGEAHRRLGGEDIISRAALYQALKRGEVPCLRLGRKIIIPTAAFERWMDSASHLVPGQLESVAQ